MCLCTVVLPKDAKQSNTKVYREYPKQIIGTWISDLGYSYTFYDNDTVLLKVIGSKKASRYLPYRIKRDVLKIGPKNRIVSPIKISNDILMFQDYQLYRKKDDGYEPLVVITEARRLDTNLRKIFGSQKKSFAKTGKYLKASTIEELEVLGVTIYDTSPFTYKVELTDEGYTILAVLHRPLGNAQKGEAVLLTNKGGRKYIGPNIKDLMRRSMY